MFMARIGANFRSPFGILAVLLAFNALVLFFYLNWKVEAVQDVSKKPVYQEKAIQVGASEKFPSSDLIVVYNRVPKTASTTFMGITQELAKKNNFHAIHVNVSRNSHILTLPDQRRLVQNISNWLEVKPAIYHGHFAYFPFTKFGVPNPIYVNILREPLDRLVSYFYFLRYGDKLRPNLKRRRQGNTETFDECIKMQNRDCSEHHFWIQIPFFCGHIPECWNVGSRWALAEAKRNLMHNYLLVGVTEMLPDFIAVLENTLPYFFEGATQLYLSGTKSHLRETKKKLQPSQETVLTVQQNAVYKMELEFYNFAKDYFISIRNRLIDSDADGALKDDQLVSIAQGTRRFHYDKIKPNLRYF